MDRGVRVARVIDVPADAVARIEIRLRAEANAVVEKRSAALPQHLVVHDPSGDPDDRLHRGERLEREQPGSDARRPDAHARRRIGKRIEVDGVGQTSHDAAVAVDAEGLATGTPESCRTWRWPSSSFSMTTSATDATASSPRRNSATAAFTTRAAQRAISKETRCRSCATSSSADARASRGSSFPSRIPCPPGRRRRRPDCASRGWATARSSSRSTACACSPIRCSARARPAIRVRRTKAIPSRAGADRPAAAARRRASRTTITIISIRRASASWRECACRS